MAWLVCLCNIRGEQLIDPICSSGYQNIERHIFHQKNYNHNYACFFIFSVNKPGVVMNYLITIYQLSHVVSLLFWHDCIIFYVFKVLFMITSFCSLVIMTELYLSCPVISILVCDYNILLHILVICYMLGTFPCHKTSSLCYLYEALILEEVRSV